MPSPVFSRYQAACFSNFSHLLLIFLQRIGPIGTARSLGG
jgi:hypothetical protein